MNLKIQLILILGIWVAIMPFLGFPVSWRKPIFIISGLAIAYLAYASAKNKTVTPISPLSPKTETYVQNTQV